MIARNFSNIQDIELTSSSKVTITKSSEFKVRVLGDDADKVEISQSGSTLTINDLSENQNSILINGNNIIIGNNNIVSGNFSYGDIYINGKKVNTSNFVEEDKNPVEIEIECPDNLSLIATLRGNASLTSTPELNKVKIHGNGVCNVQVTAQSGKFKVSGSGDINYKSLGGNLNASISGSSEIRAIGKFSDIDASISGSGELITEGEVKGDYDVSVSGSGTIRHQGMISGQRSKSVSGCALVYW